MANSNLPFWSALNLVEVLLLRHLGRPLTARTVLRECTQHKVEDISSADFCRSIAGTPYMLAKTGPDIVSKLVFVLVLPVISYTINSIDNRLVESFGADGGASPPP
eukprot:1551787-Amphidinium_carterae.2